MRFFNLTMTMLIVALGFASSARAACVESAEQTEAANSGATALAYLEQAQVQPASVPIPQTDFHDERTDKQPRILEHLITSTPKNTAEAQPVNPVTESPEPFTLPASLAQVSLLDLSSGPDSPTPVPAPGVMPAGLALLTALAAIRKLRRA